jgi:hypothetical protein
MAELNKRADRVTTADFTDRSSDSTRQKGLREWIEGDPPKTSPDLAGPRLVQDDLSNIQDPWTSPGVVTAANEGTTGNIEAVTPLLSKSEIADLHSRWSKIQADFVDEPRRSVHQADLLVANTMQRLTTGLENERAALEQRWTSEDSISTEDLRVTLQRYRAFLGRLLNAA